MKDLLSQQQSMPQRLAPSTDAADQATQPQAEHAAQQKAQQKAQQLAQQVAEGAAEQGQPMQPQQSAAATHQTGREFATLDHHPWPAPKGAQYGLYD